MKQMVANNRQQAAIAVNEDAVTIGKDVIELLTSGMYVSPITIYREYIQNAADSFDSARAQGLLGPLERGRVVIEIDHSTRSVLIRDNGAGIASQEALLRLMAIGGSPKRGTQARGFRGVGRLSGLAYCRTLEFRTKAAGEGTIISVVWDCRTLRSRLSDRTFHGDLRHILCEVVSIRCETATDKSDHFFEVHLREVARLRNDLLLNESLISQYLSQAGPIPFAPRFSFASTIEERLARHENRVPIDLTVAGKAVYRPYSDEIAIPGTQHKVTVQEIEFVEFANVDGGIGAIGWIGHHEYARSIPGALGIRGLRTRVGDVQVGEEGIFEEAFKEPRFNNWIMGEVHILDRRIVPNARRDNFEINHHYYNLLAQIGPVVAGLSQRCRLASVSRNTAHAVRNFIAEVKSRLEEGRSLEPAELSRFQGALMRARPKLGRITDVDHRDVLARELDYLESSLAEHAPVSYTAVTLDEVQTLVSKIITNKRQAKTLVAELHRLLR